VLQFVCDVVKDTGIPAPVYLHWIGSDTSRLHHLLPEPREHSITSRLRTHEKYP